MLLYNSLWIHTRSFHKDKNCTVHISSSIFTRNWCYMRNAMVKLQGSTFYVLWQREVEVPVFGSICICPHSSNGIVKTLLQHYLFLLSSPWHLDFLHFSYLLFSKWIGHCSGFKRSHFLEGTNLLCWLLVCFLLLCSCCFVFWFVSNTLFLQWNFLVFRR